MTTKPSKLLLEDADVRRWYENNSRSSTLNAKLRLQRLNLFCHQTKTTPQTLVGMGQKDPKDVEDCLLDHVSWMEENRFSPGYIDNVLKAIKAWLEYNHVAVKRKIKVTNAGIAVTLQDEKVPDQDQLRRMLATATPRGRVVISMMAFAGVRPQVMGLADASDGLRLSDLQDLVIDGSNVSFSTVPCMVVVRHNLSKTRNKYVTFVNREGCEHILGYLRNRISRGALLASDSPLIAGRSEKAAGKDRESRPCICTPAITDSIRPAIRSVTKIRPYALRAYFDTQLLLAESHGTMTHSYREFFMGHAGDMEARYTTNKGRLTEQTVEDMRGAYERSQVFLSTSTNISEEDKRSMLRDMWRKQATLHGIDPDSIISDKKWSQDVKSDAATPPKKPDESRDVPRDSKPVADAAPAEDTAPFESRLARSEAEMLKCVSHGWDIFRELADGKFLMRRENRSGKLGKRI